MRLPFKKINAEEYKINLQESLEKAKTTNDDSKKRKISTDSVDEETNAGTKTPDNSKVKTGSARKKPKTDAEAEVLIVETKPISNEDGKRKISTDSADKQTNAGTKTPDNSKAKTGSARKKAKLDVKVSKNETKPKSNDETVAKPVIEPSAIQNVKNGGAKEEVVINQKEPASKPDDNNVDVSDASKNEPTGVDVNLTPKVKVSTPKETPRIENAPFKTPEAKSRPAKDNNLTSPMENNLTSSLEKKLTPKQLARKELLDKARQEKEKQKEDARLAREAAKEKERKEKEALKEQERLEREKKKKEELDEKERLKKEKEAQKVSF